MSSVVKKVQSVLKKAGSPGRAQTSQWFFKTGKGQYGEGDLFYGITVPEQRKIAQQFFKDFSQGEIIELLKSKFHEDRFVALEMLVMKFELAVKLGDKKTQKQIYDLYLKNAQLINNWDLVDTSANYIVGKFLLLTSNELSKSRAVLTKLAKSSDLWEKRIAMISCYEFIKNNQYKDGLKIAEILLKDDHDLIHKAVGWMLREIGKKNLKSEMEFLNKFVLQMPRTTLRYAIERFPEKIRLKYLKMK